MSSEPPPPALITLTISHFCEKARWALQRYGLPYVEEAHVPGAHRPAATAAGGRGSVPCLRLPPPAAAGPLPSGSPGGDASATPANHPTASCVDQSTPILHWVDSQAAAAAAAAGYDPPPPLFPPGEQGEQAEQLCRQYDRQLGPAVRVWAYSHLLHTPAIAGALMAPPVPALERLVMRCGGWWIMRRLMAKGMRITPGNGAAKLAMVHRCFDDVASLLADGRPFLTGDTFTAADLTFVALAAPAVGQPYGVTPGLDEATPPAMRAELEELRRHPAGRFALRMWAEQRGVVLHAGAAQHAQQGQARCGGEAAEAGEASSRL